MPTKQALQTLRDFKILKKNKSNYTSDQYLKELKLLKASLQAQLSDPALTKGQMKQLIHLMAN